eukprot:TRINITY_DN1565_c1_g1_i1.p1 TRINITY_DN1565_c1_g1~~TRINITY_DN1565_c1_g1_i1.p1  ORF type:complete len:620 (+),score=241.26 TRINITY_DN1565_c1_g1_i1:75-1862(+)
MDLDNAEPPSKRARRIDGEAIGGFIANVIEKPERFLAGTDAHVGKEVIQATELLFNYAKESEPKKMSPLPVLYTQGFDSEQIWEQIQLQNEPMIKHLQKEVKGLVEDIDSVVLLQNSKNEVSEDDKYDEEQDGEDLPEEYQDDEGEDLDAEDLDEDDLEGLDDEALDERGNGEGEDKFFNIDDMEKFMDDADEEEMEEDLDGEEEEEDLEEEVLDDLGDEDDDENEAEGDGTKDMYDDFFDPEGRRREDHVDSDDEMMDDRPTDLFTEEGGDIGETQDPTPFQMKQSKLKKQVEALEEQSVKEKPWILQGEVNKFKRPENSLLEVELEFDRGAKVAPQITEVVTQNLEELIKKRIRDGVFDDVIRKKPKEDGRFRAKIELNQEKSKVGLAELYEKEYMRSLGVDEEKEKMDEKKRTILGMFNEICYALDSMANISYTKPKQRAVKTTSNLPAIAMEEVIPITVSDATRLAPQEVMARDKKEFKSKDELTTEERKSMRRAKKSANKLEKNKKEKEKKMLEKSDPKFAESQKKSQLAAIEQIKDKKNVSVGKASGEASGSTALFKKLQEETQLGIAALKKKKEQNQKPQMSSNFLKL